jgi:hypothetical protein
MKFTDQKEKFQILALTILKDWEVNMAEGKLQVLFENEK